MDKTKTLDEIFQDLNSEIIKQNFGYKLNKILNCNLIKIEEVFDFILYHKIKKYFKEKNIKRKPNLNEFFLYLKDNNLSSDEELKKLTDNSTLISFIRPESKRKNIIDCSLFIHFSDLKDLSIKKIIQIIKKQIIFNFNKNYPDLSFGEHETDFKQFCKNFAENFVLKDLLTEDRNLIEISNKTKYRNIIGVNKNITQNFTCLNSVKKGDKIKDENNEFFEVIKVLPFYKITKFVKII